MVASRMSAGLSCGAHAAEALMMPLAIKTPHPRATTTTTTGTSDTTSTSGTTTQTGTAVRDAVTAYPFGARLVPYSVGILPNQSASTMDSLLKSHYDRWKAHAIVPASGIAGGLAVQSPRATTSRCPTQGTENPAIPASGTRRRVPPRTYPGFFGGWRVCGCLLRNSAGVAPELALNARQKLATVAYPSLCAISPMLQVESPSIPSARD